MPELTCFRLLDAESPAGPLAEAVRQVNAATAGKFISIVDMESFKQIPSVAFVYWVDESVRRLFKSLPDFEANNREARQGLATADDFRFVRCWWEVPSLKPGIEHTRWKPFAKGGSAAPFFADIHLVVDWQQDGRVLGMVGNHTPSRQYYFKPGLTWPSLPHVRGAFGIVPKGCIFGHSGPMVFSREGDILADSALLNGSLYSSMLHLLMPRGTGGDNRQTLKYEVGYVSAVPVLPLDNNQRSLILPIARSLWQQAQTHYSYNEVSHNYSGPPSLDYEFSIHEFAKLFEALDKILNESPLLKGVNMTQLLQGVGRDYALGQFSDEWNFRPSRLNLAKSIISHGVGVMLGRWRNMERVHCEPYNEDDTFQFSPAALSITSTTSDWLIGDDFVARFEKSISKEFGAAQADSIFAEIVAAGFKSWIDYLSRPAGFFSDHLNRYSASRRQAPIYWPLSTKSGNFTIWVYYPKLDDQSLPKLIADVLSPKIRTLSQEIENRRATSGGKIGELEALRQELEEMRTDFLDLINRGYHPNQNDGVLITACPLAKYFRHAGFRKNLEACWKELARGDYDWAHLAMAMWPDRVLEACKKDRTIAIAHGKEELCTAEPPKAARGRKKTPSSP